MKVFVSFWLLATVTIGAMSAELNGSPRLEKFMENWNQTVETMLGELNLTPAMIYELSKFRLPTELSSDIVSPTQSENALCGVCRTAVASLLTMRRLGTSASALRTVVLGLCTGLNIVPDHVCSGVIDLNLEVLLFIIDARRQLSAETICGIVGQPLHCRLGNGQNLEWSNNVDGASDAIEEAKSEIPASSDDDLIIVHITDTHYDPHYREGADAKCADPVCCRIKQGFPDEAERGAGRWGDYRDCDSPWEAILDVYERIKANHKKIDLIYFTGDIVDHGIWETSFPGNIHSITRTFRGLKEVFPDVPIYPCIANHEPHPTNQFAPSHIVEEHLSANRLYTLLANTWDWLPEQARDTVRQFGYYTIKVREGFRIIGLNNNDGYTFNWWLMYDASYASNQLQWLHDTLLQSERDNEKVHILAHVPAGSADCFRTWSREYNRIVNRFYKTISGQFNGHSHRDELEIFYAIENPTKAINIAWNGGSATPYSHVNANYRLYNVEPQTYQVVDHETWIFNLTEANANRDDNPVWFKEYSFKSAYDLVDLSPASLDGLAEELAGNRDALYLYWQRTVKFADTALARGCDNNCLAGILCDMVTAQTGDQTVRCRQLQHKFWNLVNITE